MKTLSMKRVEMEVVPEGGKRVGLEVYRKEEGWDVQIGMLYLEGDEVVWAQEMLEAVNAETLKELGEMMQKAAEVLKVPGSLGGKEHGIEG